MSATDKTSPEKSLVREPRDLEVSYGEHVPQPAMKKGEFVAFGILGGSTSTATSVQGVRTTNFGDSVADNAKNI